MKLLFPFAFLFLFFGACSEPDVIDFSWENGKSVYLLDLGASCSSFNDPNIDTLNYTGVGGNEIGGEVSIFVNGKKIENLSFGGISIALNFYALEIDKIKIKGKTDVPLYFILRYGVIGSFEIYVDRIKIDAGEVDFVYDYLKAYEFINQHKRT